MGATAPLIPFRPPHRVQKTHVESELGASPRNTAGAEPGQVAEEGRRHLSGWSPSNPGSLPSTWHTD